MQKNAGCEKCSKVVVNSLSVVEDRLLKIKQPERTEKC